MPYPDRDLLARIIQCEAGGEGDIGMGAVASVVMNRVRAKVGEYSRLGGGSIRNVIFQPRQFTCAMTAVGGQHNPQNLYNMSPEQIHFDIADWAIAGNRIAGLGEALWFFNPYAADCPLYFPSEVGIFVARIGDHCFYAPTDAYAQT